MRVASCVGLGRQALALASRGTAASAAPALVALRAQGQGSWDGSFASSRSFDAPSRGISWWRGQDDAPDEAAAAAAAASSSSLGDAGVASAASALSASSDVASPLSVLGVTVDGIVAVAAAAEGEAEAEALEESWLPSRVLQHGLRFAHDQTGLPWWASLVVSTAALRVATWPINIAQMRRAGKVAQARPLLEEAVERFKAAQAAGDPNALAAHQARISDIWTKYDCHPVKMLAPMLVQMPVFLGMFGALRALSAAKLPSLVEGGALWCTDLTIADPTYGLPVLTCLSFLAMLELGAADGMEAQSADQRQKFKMIMRLIGLAILPFSASMPAALHLYWTSSNLIGIVQSRILRIGPVRAALNLPPTPAAAKAAAAAALAPAGATSTKPVTFAHRRPRKAGKA